MNNWRLVRLNFGKSPVHFGEIGLGMEESIERVHSDTLFSAWINAYVRLLGRHKVESLLAQFLTFSEPPLRISSTFIYNQHNDNFTYYLPCPFKSPPNYPKDNPSFSPLHHKFKYLPLPLWQRWYQDEGFTAEDSDKLANLADHIYGDRELEQAWGYHLNYSVYQVPKTTVDRVHKTALAYSTGLTQFLSAKNHSSGLYFLIQFTEEDRDLEYRLQAALDLLGEEGLGGERSNGAGRFKANWQSLPEIWQQVINFQRGDHYCLLSLFWQPSLTQQFLHNSRYQLKERGGWIYSTFSRRSIRRQKVHMFAEGSIFPTAPLGQLADVTPPEFRTSTQTSQPHPIFRNGISLTIPISVDSENDYI